MQSKMRNVALLVVAFIVRCSGLGIVDVDVQTLPENVLRSEKALLLAENHIRSTLSSANFVRDRQRCSDTESDNLSVQIRVTVDSTSHGLQKGSPSHFRRPDGFTVHEAQQTRSGLRIAVHGQSVLGAAYGLFHLAERCQLKPCTCWNERSQELEPSFSLRTLSEEGQLFDFPDVAYRTQLPPDYINTTLIMRDYRRLMQLVPFMLEHRFNSLTILHHDIEEYVEYTYLEGIEVYPTDDIHRNRSRALSRIIKQFVSEMHAYHLSVLFQPYEVSCPPQLCAKLNLSAGSPDLQRVLTARYKEFFERTGADGIIVTVSGKRTHVLC